jgi:hypothetical protein
MADKLMGFQLMVISALATSCGIVWIATTFVRWTNGGL